MFSTVVPLTTESSFATANLNRIWWLKILLLIADLLQTWKFHQAFSTFEQFPNPSKISKHYPSESFLLTCGDQLCLKVVFKTWKSITDVTLSKVAANGPSTAQLSQETHGWDENNIRVNCYDQKHLPVESWVPSSPQHSGKKNSDVPSAKGGACRLSMTWDIPFLIILIHRHLVVRDYASKEIKHTARLQTKSLWKMKPHSHTGSWNPPVNPPETPLTCWNIKLPASHYLFTIGSWGPLSRPHLSLRPSG